MSRNLLFFILGNIFLFTIVYVTRRQKRLNNILLLVTSIFFFLSLIETVYRNFINSAHNYLPQGGAATAIKDSSIPSLSYSRRPGYVNADSPVPNVIFLGCSFTFGLGVDDAGTLPYKFGAVQHVSTLNLGGVGFGTHQVYEIFLDKYANKENDHKTFIYTMIPDHVLRASGIYDFSAGPSFRLSGDSVIYAGPLPSIDKKMAYYASFFGCYSFIKDMVLHIQQKRRAEHISGDEYQKTYVMIRNLDRYSKATGGHFVLLFWDNLAKPGDPNKPYRQVMEDKLEKLAKDSVDVVRVSDIINAKDPKYYIPNDGHPNAIAYDTVAKYLARHIKIL